MWRIVREERKKQKKKFPGTGTGGGLERLVAPFRGALLYGNAQQDLDWEGLDSAGHASILHMATVSFAPARKLALVDGVFGSHASHIVHPDQTGTCTQRGGMGRGGVS